MHYIYINSCRRTTFFCENNPAHNEVHNLKIQRFSFFSNTHIPNSASLPPTSQPASQLLTTNLFSHALFQLFVFRFGEKKKAKRGIRKLVQIFFVERFTTQPAKTVRAFQNKPRLFCTHTLLTHPHPPAPSSNGVIITGRADTSRGRGIFLQLRFQTLVLFSCAHFHGRFYFLFDGEKEEPASPPTHRPGTIIFSLSGTGCRPGRCLRYVRQPTPTLLIPYRLLTSSSSSFPARLGIFLSQTPAESGWRHPS